MSQKDLVIEYIAEHGSILPAKMGGVVYKGVMFGSETTRRCREMEKTEENPNGILEGRPDGRFVRYFFVENHKAKNPPPTESKQNTLMYIPPIKIGTISNYWDI